MLQGIREHRGANEVHKGYYKDNKWYGLHIRHSKAKGYTTYIEYQNGI